MPKYLTIQEALKAVLESKEFKEFVKYDAYTRVYSGRIRKGKLSEGAAVRLLQDFGFKIYAVQEKTA